jgi:hypothetical protein
LPIVKNGLWGRYDRIELKTIGKEYSKLNELPVKEQKLQPMYSIDEAYKDSEFKKDLEAHISNLINHGEKK